MGRLGVTCNSDNQASQIVVHFETTVCGTNAHGKLSSTPLIRTKSSFETYPQVTPMRTANFLQP